MSLLFLTLLLLVAVILFHLLLNLKWWVATIRDIARDSIGYTKLVQLLMVVVLTSIFITIIIYYLLNPGQVDRIDVILTVVVGWLGAIIGSFFGERAMKGLEEERKVYAKRSTLKIDEYNALLNHLREKISNKK